MRKKFLLSGMVFFMLLIFLGIACSNREKEDKGTVEEHTKITVESNKPPEKRPEKEKADTVPEAYGMETYAGQMEHAGEPAAAVIPETKAKKRRGIPVLMYHSIDYEPNNPVRLPKEKFQEQMDFLKTNGYSTLSLDELYQRLRDDSELPEKSVVITFDDGYADNYTNAFPVLKAYGFKASVFVITDAVDHDPHYLSSDQLKEMCINGISIESHTVKHEKLSDLPYQEQLQTLKNSKSRLEQILDKKVEYIAYPFGAYNRETGKCLQEAGYKMAFTINKGWATQDSGLFLLPRVFIDSTFDIGVFKERITNPDYKIYNNSSPSAGKDKTAEKGKQKDGNKPVDPEKLKKLEETYNQGYDYFMNKKDYKKAIELENSVIQEDPDNYKAYNVKGIALCFAGNFDEGMKDIDKALELKPDFGYARFNKALAYELYRQYDKALEWYDKALEIENSYVWSYYGKASIYGRKGDAANTVKYLKTAIGLDPAVKELMKEEKDFDNVRNSTEFKELLKDQ